MPDSLSVRSAGSLKMTGWIKVLQKGTPHKESALLGQPEVTDLRLRRQSANLPQILATPYRPARRNRPHLPRVGNESLPIWYSSGQIQPACTQEEAPNHANQTEDGAISPKGPGNYLAHGVRHPCRHRLA